MRNASYSLSLNPSFDLSPMSYIKNFNGSTEFVAIDGSISVGSINNIPDSCYVFDYSSFFSNNLDALSIAIDKNGVFLDEQNRSSFVFDRSYSNSTYFDKSSLVDAFGISDSSSSSFSSSSLNGNFNSFLDGASVLCYPNDREYNVVRSYLGFATGNTLTIIYDLIDSNNKNHTAPHDALKLKD